MISGLTNADHFRDLAESSEVFRNFAGEFGLLPYEWFENWLAFQKFKEDSLFYLQVPSLSHRDVSSIIENCFYVQLELF